MLKWNQDVRSMWTYKNNHYYKTLMAADEYNCKVEEQVWNPGFSDLLKDVDHIIGYYIVDGSVHLYDETYEKDTLLWITGGSSLNILSETNLHVIAMNSPLPLCSCPMEVVSIGDYATSVSFTSRNVRHQPMMPRLYSA